ncbi:hypothetical protein ACJU26_07850 [Acidithiobacillus sp. M4-SHS-6]|uniref:hypothetical protein n=1 Tax=Acidithiobacillus sp. M4-SHS-6 TaxID=3383024 RepID=UPI0039BE63B5
MNETERQARIQTLQNRRHQLLHLREERGAPVASIDMELNVVRSELQALYAMRRSQDQAAANAGHHSLRHA